MAQDVLGDPELQAPRGPAATAPGDLGAWERVARIAHDAEGETWRARLSSAECTVRILPPTPDAATAGRVEQAARTLASTRHPHIAPVVTHGREPGSNRCWLAIHGEPVAHPPRRPWSHARQTLATLLAALAHAHARGLIHGGRPPLWRVGDTLVLGDVGLNPTQRAERGPWTDLAAFAELAAELVDNPPETFEPWLARLATSSPTEGFQRAVDAAHALDHLDQPTDRAPLPPSWRPATGAPEYTGREHVRSLLWSALRDVIRREEGAAVLIRGAPGAGRSHLADWIAECAHERAGVEVVRGRHSEVGGPLEGIDGMPWVPAVAERLTRLARRRPTVVVLDDVHHGADALDLADALVDVPAPILCVLTAPDRAPAPRLASRLAALGRRERVCAVRVDALARRETAALLRELAPLHPDTVEVLVDRVLGLPQVAVHLLDALTHRRDLVPGPGGLELRAGAAPPWPETLEDAWRLRLATAWAGLPEEACQATELAAALGLVIRRDEWAGACQAAGLSADPEGLTRLADAGLARTASTGWSLARPALRDALRARARRGGRLQDHHRACAAVCYGARRGRHLFEAGEHDAAARALLHGARELSRAGATRQAEAALQLRAEALRALGIPPEHPRWTPEL